MNRKRKNNSLSQDISKDKRSKTGPIHLNSSQVVPGRAGRILKIYLKNFMCHSALEINFDLNTNYLIGRNGSGKSAILTALIVGLGGKAKTTNRGSNMKSFIKVGQVTASIEITLSNTGPMAYNPKLFGPEITIVRNITDVGGNMYKIKNANGNIISTAFRDIHRITDALNIHIDNPVCILNQHVARTFLNTNDPEKKYIMFMKATNLESVKLQYKLALQNKKKSNIIFNTKLEELEKLEQEVKKWLKKYEAFKNVNKVEDLKKKLEVEVVWAQINTIESELKVKEEKVEEYEKDIKSYQDLLSNRDERKKSLNEKLETIRQQLLEIRNEEESNQTQINQKKHELQKFRENLLIKKNECVAVGNVIKRKENDKKTIEEEISKSSDYHQTKLRMIQERDANMNKAEKEYNEFTKRLETAENDLNKLRGALNMKTTEQNNISTELNEVSNNVKQKKMKVNALKNDKSNSISVYGENVRKTLELINVYKDQFHILPKGPIGSYIKLKDKKWALAIEDIIGAGMLMGFAVDNQNDAQVLSNIFKKTCSNYQPTIINSKFLYQVHDYSEFKVQTPKGCIALIDMLLIKDPVIMNCLIDQLAIENVILIPDNNQAIDLMSQEDNVPNNCNKGVTLSGDLFFPDPNYRFYACKTKIPRYLQISATEAIKIYEDELSSQCENETTLRQQLRAVNSEVLKLNSEIINLEKKCHSLECEKQRAERDINKFKLIQLPAEPNLQILSEEMEEISKIIENKKVDLNNLKQETENIKSQMNEVDEELINLQNMSKNLVSKMKPLIDEKSENDLKLKQIFINANHHNQKLQVAKEKLEVAQKEFDLKKSFLRSKLEEALKLGNRVKTKRSVEVILKELEDFKQQLADAKASLGDKVMISKTYMRVQQKYDKTKEEVTKVKNCLQKMIETVDSRSRMYHRLAEYIGIRVSEMFTGVLKLRQFKGTIQIDHDKQMLDLIVIPQHGSSQSKGHTHTLSGGERSYSTVAFLHALWQVMEYPFYILDEFDVFMDKVNRRIVMEILLEHAKEHKELQFVFLTPQDVSDIIGDKNITVHRMADPER